MTCCTKWIRPALLLSFATATLLILAGCQGISASGGGPTPSPSATPTPTPASLNSINHIILFMQENRSFDHYFGQINLYRASQGLPQEVDTWGPSKTPTGVQTNSYDPVTGHPGPPIQAFHMQSACSENLSPSWNESHRMMSFENPAAITSSAQMDGFAFVEGKFAHDEFVLNGAPNFTDFTGKRAMGYYDQNDLPFYYFMATNFAMSDRFFSPVPTRTTPNRMYWLAATSQGWIVPPTQQVNAKTIFELMDNAHITWKIYLAGKSSYYFIFPYSNTHRTNVVPVSQYFTDAQNGTLPQVAYIETGVEGANGTTPSAVDEHPNDNVQTGAAFAEKLMTALMNSQSWKDSVFIHTYDEGGGLYDHVPPMSVPSPDGVPPLLNTANGIQHTPGDFTITGFRVPMFVVSPFAKKNFVSHTPMDSTSVLKFIEMRFNLPSLTNRDASMPGLNEFFDFSTPNGPWATPPTPPQQTNTLPCTFGVPQG